MTKYRQLCNGFELFCRFQLLNAVFSSFWSTIIQIWRKSENLKIQDGGHLWRHLYDSGCHGDQLNTSWFYLFESIKKLIICTNIMPIGWIVSKVDREPIDTHPKTGVKANRSPSPPLSILSCLLLSFCIFAMLCSFFRLSCKCFYSSFLRGFYTLFFRACSPPMSCVYYVSTLYLQFHLFWLLSCPLS